MNVAEKLKSRRTELGLSQDEVAKTTGVTWNEYFDVENHSDELVVVTALATVKKLCALLQLNLLDLCGFACLVCNGQAVSGDDSSPRNELIRKQRLEARLSQDELGDRLGWDADVIQRIETIPDHLESWSIDNIQDLAKEINAPLQRLLGVKCKKGHA